LIIANEAVLKGIAAEGEKSYPNECCGIIFGRVGEKGEKRVEFIKPIRNSRAAEERYHRFRIEPGDYLRAEVFAAENGLDIIGFYHSHPDHPAVPSEYDREHAFPYYSYIIVSVCEGRVEDITSWELTSDRTTFVKEF
jgi:proteasome lid subunit RPN8/RPN11